MYIQNCMYTFTSCLYSTVRVHVHYQPSTGTCTCKTTSTCSLSAYIYIVHVHEQHYTQVHDVQDSGVV